MKRKGQPDTRDAPVRGNRRGLPRRRDLLARTALALAIGVGLPAMAPAGDAPGVQPSLHDGRQPALIKAKNGIPVVNIVAPGKHGVSHNTYTRLDVGQQGLIFNNGADISKTRLAGYVTGNAHLAASGSARIILNEVVSTRPSQLDGYMEVAGTPAELVIANPNGITCAGCGFINTPRAVLTTGTPVIGADGGLSGFRVTRGRINIRGAGLDASHIDRVDLLARAVDVNAKLWAQRLNVVAGANRIAYGNLAATPIDGTGDKPAVAIDVAALGGMYANAIRLVGTEAGVGVNIEGETAAQAGDFTLTSAGEVMVDGRTTATGTVTVGAAQSVDVDGVLASGGSMDVHGHALDLAGTVYSGQGTTLAAAGDIRNQGQVQAHAGSLAMSAGGEIANAATGVLYAGKDIGIDTGALVNAGGIEAARAVQVHAADALTNQGVLQADQAGLSIQAQTLGNTGTWSAHDDIDAAATARLDTSGQLIAGRDVTLHAGDLATSGTVQAGKSLSLTAASLANSGRLYALGGPWHADIAGAFGNAAEGDIYAADTLTLTAQNFDNAGGLEAVGTLKADILATLTNSGVMQSDQAGLTLDGNRLANTGTWSAAGDMALAADAGIDTTGTVVAGGNLSLAGAAVTTGGTLEAGKAATLTSRAGLDNAGTVQAGGTLAVDAGGNLTNETSGLVYGSADVTLEAGGDLDNAGTLYASGGLDVTAATLHNANVLRSAAGVDVEVTGAAWNTGTAYGLTASQWQVGGAFDNAGVLASGGDTTLAAASLKGDGTLAAGLGSDGTLGQSGNLEVATRKALQATGRNLAAGNLDLSGSALELAGSQTFAGGDAGLAAKAGDIGLAGATLAAHAATFTASGRLVNGGTSVADGGQIGASSLRFDVAGIDNRYGTIEQTGNVDLDIELAGAFDNAHGTFAVNADNLTLAAAALDNTAGNLQHAGNGRLTLASTSRIDNTGGTIAGNGALTLHAAGMLDNATGTLGVLQAATVQAATFDNAGGTLAANGLAVTVAGQVDNTDGTLASTAALNLAADSLVDGAGGAVKATGNDALAIALTGTLTNASGAFLGGNGGVVLQAARLVNAGQIYAGGDLSVTTTDGSLDNTGGRLQAMGSLAVDSVASLTNTSGNIEAGAGDSGATLVVHAAGVDNRAGRLANAGAGGTTLVIGAAVDNQSGTLGGDGDVALTATRLANGSSGKLVAGRDLDLALASLANASGTVYAARNLAWSHDGATLGNAGGNVGAGGNLDLALGRVDNTGGNLDAGNDLTLTLTSLDGEGRVVAGHDLGLALSGGYTNGSGNTLKANHDLSLTIGGSFDNAAAATLEAVHGLTVHAAGITNAAGATFHSAITTLVAAHDLDNQGEIEGDSIDLTAATLSNSGSIMGAAITVHAGTLTNGTDLGTTTDNTPYQTGLIASTGRLDLYVTGILRNRDAWIFSIGNIRIAADDHGHAAAKVVNESGKIGSDGSITIDARTLTNKRRQIDYSTTANLPIISGMTPMLVPTGPGGPGGRPGGSSMWNTLGTIASIVPLADADPVVQAFCAGLSGHNQCMDPALAKRADTWVVTSVTRITDASAASKIAADQNIVLNGSVLNDASTIAAGQDLIIDGQSYDGSGQENADFQNLSRAPSLTFQHTRTVSIPWEHWNGHGHLKGGSWEKHTQTFPGLYVSDDAPPPDTDWVLLDGTPWATLRDGTTLSARVTAGNTVTVDVASVENEVVDADKRPVNGAIALGGNHRGSAVTGYAGSSVQAVASGDTHAAGVGLGQVPAVQTGTHDGADSLPPQTVASLTGSDTHIGLPQSGLYTIHKSPGSSYLVETDPRFANYANFISSDYLLGHLGYDPAAVDKRLGDGFYEERQVLDQITDLTGRRFLTADIDALNQYRALMDNAVTAAKKFHLSVGVALTADQMADLTHDMVWLVSEKVDGQSVLVPVVYLSQSDAQQLTQSGAVIAGRNVVLNATGDITNNGSIAASQDASIKADNLLNRGTLTAGADLGIQAAHDILNQGGIIRGADVSLAAGHDVVSRADIGPVDIGGVNLGAIDTGSITATHDLSVRAGRDVSLDAVHIKAGDTLQLAAGRDLTATASRLAAGRDLTVRAGRDMSLDATQSHAFHGNARHFTVTTTHHVTHLDAGDTLTVAAGRDLVSHGVKLQAGNTLDLAAGRNLTLAAVTDHTHTFSKWHHGHTSGTTVTDDDALHGTTLTSTHGVNLSAGHDATLVATDVASSKGDVTMQAGHDIHLDAGHEEHDWSQDTRTHHSSLLSSSTTTTHDATQDSRAIGSTLSGEAVTVVAGHDLGTHAAQVAGTHDVTLATGHALAIGTAANHHAEQHRIKKKKSGVFGGGGASGLGGIGFTVGSQKAGATSTVDQHTTTGSLVGSTQGNVTLVAGGNLDVIGSDLIAGRAKGSSQGGNIRLQGQNVTITSAAQNEHDTNTRHQSQHGFSMALTGTLLDGVRNVKQTRHEQAGSGKKNMDTLHALEGMAGDMPGISMGYGKHSTSRSSQFNATTQRGSSLHAAGNLGIKATAGDITVAGSTLSAGGKATLVAQRNVALLASQATQSQSSQNASHGKSYMLDAVNGGDVVRFVNGGANSSGVSMSPYNSVLSTSKGTQRQASETGTTISAGQINILSHTGDITTQGAQLDAQGDINLLAQQGAINLNTGTASQRWQHTHHGHQVGDLGGTGYAGTVGERKERGSQQGVQTTQNTLRTRLASQHGDVNVLAKGDLTGRGVDISGRDVTLTGRNVLLLPGQDTSAQQQRSHTSQFGVTLAMSGVAVQAAQAADAAVSAQDAGNNRLAALYAAEAAYGAKDSKAVVAGKSSTDLVKATVSIGGGSQSSNSGARSSTQQGSTITASRNVTITATGDGKTGADGYAEDGDIVMQGAQLKAGNSVSLSAARDIDLLASSDTNEQSNHHHASSGSVGVGFGLGGEQNGFTIELAAAAAKGKAKGNGTTYTATQVSAGNTLSLISGRDTTLDGAQARGQTILADVGRNLTLTSTQDSNQYTEKDQSASAGLSLCIPPFCYGISSGGASYHQTDIGNNYRSVTDQTGLAAGRGGFQIHVGGTTSLTGAALASTADASKNLLDTGNLVVTNLHNTSDSHASQEGASFSSGGLGKNLTQNTVGAALSLAVPQGGSHSSDTQSAIAQGTITVRNHPGQDVSGIDRDATTLDGQGVANDFDLDKIKENQQLGQAAGYVGMRAAGDLEQKLHWDNGSAGAMALHAVAGGAAAALGGGNAAQGALGAAAGEAVLGVMPKQTTPALVEAASTLVGGLVGGGAGAATANAGELYNYLTHLQLKKKKAQLAACETAQACQKVHAYWDRVSASQSATMAASLPAGSYSIDLADTDPHWSGFDPQLAEAIGQAGQNGAISPTMERMDLTLVNEIYGMGTIGPIQPTTANRLYQNVVALAHDPAMVASNPGIMLAPGVLNMLGNAAAGMQAFGQHLKGNNWLGTNPFTSQQYMGVEAQNLFENTAANGALMALTMGTGALPEAVTEDGFDTVGLNKDLLINGDDVSLFPPNGTGGRVALSNGYATDMEAGGASQYDPYRLTNGDWNWPSNHGTIPGTQSVHDLQVGQLVDRIGPTKGAYLSPTGSSLTSRSLAPGSATSYTQYRVLKPFTVEDAEAKPAFGEQGHGTQFRILSPSGKHLTVQDLIDKGFLEEIK